MKREGSLGEACALSLPLCLRLTPLLTPAHKPSALNHPRVPHVHPCPRAGGGASPCSAQVRRHGLPPVSHGAWWLQGLKETTGWQAGGAMEDVLPETLGDGLMGKEVRHPEPS